MPDKVIAFSVCFDSPMAKAQEENTDLKARMGVHLLIPPLIALSDRYVTFSTFVYCCDVLSYVSILI